MNHFNWIDYSILGVVGISTLISFVRGFVQEAVSLGIWVLAFLLSFRFSGVVANALHSSIKSPSLRYAIGFIAIFILILVIGIFVNAFVGTLVSKTGVGSTDRFLGVFFGAARGLLMIAAILVLANYSAATQAESYKKSTLIPYFNNVVFWMKKYVPEQLPDMNNFFSSGNQDSLTNRDNNSAQ